MPRAASGKMDSKQSSPAAQQRLMPGSSQAASSMRNWADPERLCCVERYLDATLLIEEILPFHAVIRSRAIVFLRM